jgi:hypothetical protein
MKKYLPILGSFFVCIFIVLPQLAGAAQAASFSFDKTTYSVNANDTFTVGVVVDPGSEQITSVDSYVTFDKALLSAQTVAQGTYFPTVLNDIQPGRVYIAGLVEDPSVFKTGQGTVATITFKALAAGVVTLAFDCKNTADTSKIIRNDVNATNIIICTDNKAASVNISAGATSLPNTAGSGTITPTVTPIPTATIVPTATLTPTPTLIASSSASSPSALLKTGTLDNIFAAAVPGFFLVLFAVVLKVMGTL